MAHQFEGTDLVFYTVREVEAGESLCFSYTPPGGVVEGGAPAWAVLSTSWCFACRCGRCTGGTPAEQVSAYDQAHVCSCGQARVPRQCLRKEGGDGLEIAGLVERWASAEGKREQEICCCNVWNMMVQSPYTDSL